MKILLLLLGIAGILILTFLLMVFVVFAEAAIEIFAEKVGVKKQQKIKSIKKEVEND